MAPQAKGGIRGISPTYLSHIEKLTSAFEECILSDRLVQALNVLRLLDALAIGDDLIPLLQEYKDIEHKVVLLANQNYWQTFDNVEKAQIESIGEAKGLLINHLQLIYQKLHARDAFVHETYFFEGGIPG